MSSGTSGADPDDQRRRCELDGEQTTLEWVGRPDGEPSTGARETGAEERPGERTNGRGVSVGPKRGAHGAQAVSDVEGGVVPELALQRCVRRLLVGKRSGAGEHGVKSRDRR